jgi:hypothetical protein
MISAAIGVVITLCLLGLGNYLYELGLERFGYFVYWPNALLQSLIPLHNIGTAKKPMYEGTPINIAAFFLSVPLGTLAHYTLVFWFLSWRKRIVQNCNSG